MDKFVVRTKKVSEVETIPQESCSTESESSNDDQSGTKKKIKLERKFRQQWKEVFPWREEKLGKSFCTVCNKSLMNLKPHLDRHEKTPAHQKNNSNSKNQICINNMEFIQDKTFSNAVKKAELCLVMFILMHHLPISLSDFMIQLLKTCCPDSTIAKQISCGRTKASLLIKNVLAQTSKEEIANLLRNNFFSIIVDETTDISSSKALALVARIYEQKSNQVRDKFFGLIELNKSDAQSIFESIKNHMDKLNIPLKNIVGLATDNASVMVGELNGLNGLHAKFKNINPNIFSMRCICHSLNLCSSYACKMLPTKVERLARDTYNFFSHSSKRISEFKEFQDFYNIKQHKILNVSKTRWLSLEIVVNRILEQWQGLQLYFISCYLEDDLHDSQKLAEELGNPYNKIYFYFLSYILKVINNMNLEFQSESFRLHSLYSTMESQFRVILSNFITLEHLKEVSCLSLINIRNERIYLPLEEIYIGAKADAYIVEMGHITTSCLTEVRRNILAFYIELCVQIQSRFDFNNRTLKLLKYLDPKVALESNESIVPLIQIFPNLFCTGNIDSINAQWRLLKFQKNIPSLDVENFWGYMYSVKNALNEPLFKDLSRFMMNLMSLPHSSAAAERVFSDLKLVKTDKGNRFNLKTVEEIMFAKEQTKCKSIDLKNHYYVWYPKD